MEIEIWKDIIGHEGLYQVSNFSRIKALKKVSNMPRGGTQTYEEKILSNCINSRGYYIIGLFKNRKRKIKMPHVLSAEAFIPNPENKPFVNHKDLNKLNCNISNLEWCTAKENSKHAYENGALTGCFKGKKVINTITQETFNTTKEAAISIGLKREHLNSMLIGKIKNKTNFKRI